MKVLQKSVGETPCRKADTSKSSHDPPVEPRARVEPGSGKHSVFSHQIVISAGRPTQQGLLAEDVLDQSCPERNILVT